MIGGVVRVGDGEATAIRLRERVRKEGGRNRLIQEPCDGQRVRPPVILRMIRVAP